MNFQNIEPEIYVIGLIHNLAFLKEEMTAYYPHWGFHSGHHGFLTYRMDKDYSLEEIRDLKVTFSLCQGKLLFSGTKEEVEAKALLASEIFEAITIHRWDLFEEKGEMGDRKNRGNVIDILRTGKNVFHLGVRFQVRGDFAPFNGTSPIPMPENVPTTAYQKLGEAFKHFRPHLAHEEVVLDIGCSPGGSTYYLLSKGYRVIGVDPEPVSKVIGEEFKEGFLQLTRPFSALKAKNLKGLPPVNWVVIDIDEPARETLSQVLKLMNKLDECLGLFLTVKLDIGFSIKDIEELESIAREHGYGDIRKSQLPSHDKEFCLFALKPEHERV